MVKKVKQLEKVMEWLKRVPYCPSCNKFNHLGEQCEDPPRQRGKGGSIVY